MRATTTNASPRFTHTGGIVGLLLIMAVGACGGNDDLAGAASSNDSPTTTRPAVESAPTTEAPTAEAPTTEAPSTAAPSTEVDGLPLTAARVAGIWYEDAGTGMWPQPILARFASDGTFALGGVLNTDSWINGTYAVEGQAITFTPTGGACGGRDTFTWDVVIVADGRLEGVSLGSDGDRPGLIGECTVPVGEPYNFTRISPTSPAAANITAANYSGPPLTSDTNPVDLEGYWLVEGTGHLLRWDWSGSYRLDSVGQMATNPQDAGRGEIGPLSLNFTSGGSSHGCAEGDLMAWENVLVEDGRLRGVVNGDSCAHGIGREVTLLFLGVDAP